MILFNSTYSTFNHQFAEEYPEARVIKQEQIKSIKFRTVCIDGYKFLNTDNR